MENVSPFLNAVRRENAPTMILDFSGVPYLDSSGLGSLVSACTSAPRRAPNGSDRGESNAC